MQGKYGTSIFAAANQLAQFNINTYCMKCFQVSTKVKILMHCINRSGFLFSWFIGYIHH